MANRHPIPPKRRRRRAVMRLALGLAAAGALMCMASPVGRAPEPEATSRPYYIVVTPAPTATPTVWVRYGIDLDDELQQYITAQAEAKQIDPALVMAIIEVESGCDPDKQEADDEEKETA